MRNPNNVRNDFDEGTLNVKIIYLFCEICIMVSMRVLKIPSSIIPGTNSYVISSLPLIDPWRTIVQQVIKYDTT